MNSLPQSQHKERARDCWQIHPSSGRLRGETETERERERKRERDRQTERQIERQRDRERQTDRQTETERMRERESEGKRERESEGKRERGRTVSVCTVNYMLTFGRAELGHQRGYFTGSASQGRGEG